MSVIFAGAQVIRTPAAAVYANLPRFTTTIWAKVVPGTNVSMIAFAKDPTLTYGPTMYFPAGFSGGMVVYDSTFDSNIWYASTFTGSNAILPYDNAWHHIAVVWDDATPTLQKIYKDGVLYTGGISTFFAHNGPRPSDAGDGYWIGSDSFAGDYFVGKLSDFRLYAKLLSPAEIVADFQGTLASNLVARWTMCANDGGLKDASGNGNNGVWFGAPAALSTDDPTTGPCQITLSKLLTIDADIFYPNPQRIIKADANFISKLSKTAKFI